jgi:uncharacterized protein YbcI
MVKLMAEFAGRGPTKARAAIDGDLIVIVLKDTITTAERHLIEADRTDIVMTMRKSLKDAMEPRALEQVEEITGRRVIAFLSDSKLDPDVTSEVFVLEQGDPPHDGRLRPSA